MAARRFVFESSFDQFERINAESRGDLLQILKINGDVSVQLPIDGRRLLSDRVRQGDAAHTATCHENPDLLNHTISQGG